MAELTEVIKISEQVKNVLEEIKEEEGHTSLDSVIRTLIQDRKPKRKWTKKSKKEQETKTND